MAVFDMPMFEKALEIYKHEYGVYPSTKKGLNALVENNILKRVKLDSFGNKYVYAALDSKLESFIIISLGRDGKLGGNLCDSDFSNLNINDYKDFDAKCGFKTESLEPYYPHLFWLLIFINFMTYGFMKSKYKREKVRGQKSDETNVRL